MRLGVALSHQDLGRALRRDHDDGGTNATAVTIARIIDLAIVADGAGAATVWVSEDPDGWDAFALLATIAARTDRIGLATAVTSPLGRHPNLIAASIATLDLLSGGRATLGIGRGEPDWYRDGLGMAVPSSPIGALEEAIHLVRRWWTPPYRAGATAPPLATDGVGAGRAFPVRDWERAIGPWPARKGGPPIVVAAVGPRALRLAGRVADGVMFNDLASDDWLRGAVQTVRAGAADSGRDPAALRFVYNSPALVTDDPEPELRRRRALVALVNALPGMEAPLRGAGYGVDPIIAAVRQTMRTDAARRDGGGFAAVRRHGDLHAAMDHVPIELIDRLAIVGSPDHVRSRLATLADIGIDEVMVRIPLAGQPASILGDRIRELRGLTPS